MQGLEMRARGTEETASLAGEEQERRGGPVATQDLVAVLHSKVVTAEVGAIGGLMSRGRR